MMIPLITHRKDGTKRDPKETLLTIGQKIAAWIKAQAKNRRLLQQIASALAVAGVVGVGVTGWVFNSRLTAVESAPAPQADTKALEASTADLAERVDRMRALAEKLSNEVEGLKGEVPDEETRQRVEALARSVSTASSDLSELTGRLKQTADDLEGTVDKAITKQARDLADLADVTARNAAVLAQTLKSNSEADAELASAVDTLSGTMSDLADRVSSLESAVAEQADDLGALVDLVGVIRGLVPAGTNINYKGTLAAGASDAFPSRVTIRPGGSDMLGTVTATLSEPDCTARFEGPGPFWEDPVLTGPGPVSTSTSFKTPAGSYIVTAIITAGATPCTYSGLGLSFQRLNPTP